MQGFLKVAALLVLGLFSFVALNREQSRHRRVHPSTVVPQMKKQQINVSLSPPRPIRQISILGERNSGTRWTFGHLSKCFNHSLHVERHLTRYKHWFQSLNSTRYMRMRMRNTLVIAQFRDPYDWLEAMRTHPHHAPKHLNVEWQEFLQKPWTMERIGTDLNITSNHTTCQQGFRYNEIVSCNKEPLTPDAYNGYFFCSRHQPFYELKQDGSGMPFENIMEMRSAKIRNFLQTREYPMVIDFMSVQYEKLLALGTKNLLDQISHLTGVPYKCDPFPIQHRPQRKLSEEFSQYVTEHIDWKAEQLIGYYPKTKRLPPKTFVLDKNRK